MNVSAGLTPVANYAYALMASGHRIGAVETRFANPLNPQPTTLKRLYRYDRTYRLTNETINTVGTSSTSSELSYSYDRVGNRLQLQSTQPGILSSLYSYDANDRLNTSAAEQFDNNGNTLFASGFAMTQADQYDFENRLIRRREGDKTVTIVYDGDGNRAKKIVTTSTNTVTTWFLVDTVNLTGYAQVLEELETRNAELETVRVYSYGHDLISQQQFTGSGWELHFFGYDGHGNTRLLTDANGFVTDTYDYDAFGNLIARTGSTANNYLFTGEQFDPDLGLYFLRARYQDAQTGRFWTMDHFEGENEDPVSLHKYLYSSCDPVNNWDPTGKMTLKEVMATLWTWGRIFARWYSIGSAVMHTVIAIYDWSQFFKCLSRTREIIELATNGPPTPPGEPPRQLGEFGVFDDELEFNKFMKENSWARPCWPLLGDAVKETTKAGLWFVVRFLLLRSNYNPFTSEKF